MSKAIFEAKQIIRQQLKYDYMWCDNGFVGYQKGYFITNENIDGYLNLTDLYSSNSEALTVTSSGDHAFNLIQRGVLNVDTFDVNYLTEYIALGLKRAMILKYDYFEFMTIFWKFLDPLISLYELSDLISGLLPYMEKEHKIFWKKVLDYNYKLQKNNPESVSLIYLLCTGLNSYSSIFHIFNNTYMQDEFCYGKLRNNLSNANITFSHVDAIDLAKKYNGKKYDLILLSNILDYFYLYWGDEWDYSLLGEYLDSLEGITKENAVIFVKYIFGINMFNFNNSSCDDMNFSREDIKEEFFDILDYNANKEINGMILRRVKPKV